MTIISSIDRVDRLHPVDQRHMRARQRPRGELRLEQRAQRGQFLDPLVGELRRRDPARGRQLQRALGHQPPHRLARRRHADPELRRDAAQRQRRARRHLAVHDPGAKRAVDAARGPAGGCLAQALALDHRRMCRRAGAGVKPGRGGDRSGRSRAGAARRRAAAATRAAAPSSGQSRCDHRPEARRMVELGQMRHLVRDHVVEHRRRRHRPAATRTSGRRPRCTTPSATAGRAG